MQEMEKKASDDSSSSTAIVFGENQLHPINPTTTTLHEFANKTYLADEASGNPSHRQNKKAERNVLTNDNNNPQLIQKTAQHEIDDGGSRQIYHSLLADEEFGDPSLSRNDSIMSVTASADLEEQRKPLTIATNRSVRFGTTLDDIIIHTAPPPTASDYPPTLSSRRTSRYTDLRTGCQTRRSQSVQSLPSQAMPCSQRTKLRQRVTGFMDKLLFTDGRKKKQKDDIIEAAADGESSRGREYPDDNHNMEKQVQHQNLTVKAEEHDIEANLDDADHSNPAPSGKVYRIQSCHGATDDSSRSKRLQQRCCRRRGAAFLSIGSFFSAAENLQWAFRVPIWQAILMAYVHYMLFIMLFAVIIWGSSIYHPQCIINSSVADDEGVRMIFMDVVHFSWTTFSTVGYGAIAPQLQDDGQCLGLNALMAVESFVGVLFASVTGAIMFAKVARMQSVAMVKFSDPICVRYGSGVMQACAEDVDGDDDDELFVGADDGSGVCTLRTPCPILEFRLVNQLSLTKGGEIMDATINVVATTLAEVDEAEIKSQIVHLNHRERFLKHGAETVEGGGTAKKLGGAATAAARGVGGVAHLATRGIGEAAGVATKGVGGAFRFVAKTVGAKTTTSNEPKDGTGLLGTGTIASPAAGSLIQRINHSMSRPHGTDVPESDFSDFEPHSAADGFVADRETAFIQAELEQEKRVLSGVSHAKGHKVSVRVEEGDSVLSPCRIFHKLSVESDRHPFFKRVWTIRHRLDEGSPLLDRVTRLKIAANDGFWPLGMNGHEEVRQHLRFKEIICIFSGTSNASGSSVFAQKLYQFSDVNVGYSFANVLSLNKNGVLFVDQALLNDVTEQPGGGAESLDDFVVPDDHALFQAANGARDGAI